MRIDSKDISVVVQGAVDSVNTPLCLNSIRKHLPQAEIILSTWEGTNVDGLDYDKVIFNQDPGGFYMSPCEINNVKRQILSTLQGIKKANRKYILKIRSDMKISGANFLKYFGKFNNYNKKWHFLKERIIIPSMVTRDPRIWESPMCPSDWCSFGLKSDMLKLWNIRFPTKEEENFFIEHPRPTVVSSIYPTLVSRFNPEQFIWIGFIKKYVKDLHVEHMFDVNKESIKETLLSFANNLIILSEKQFCIQFLKPARKGSDRWHIITYNSFLKIYNKFAGGHKIVFPFDIQRLGLWKYFLQSNKRLYKRAKEQYSLSSYYKKEAKYISYLFYCLIKPIIILVKKYEDSNRPELWWNVKDYKKPNFSIVIPVHGNVLYFSQVLDCLKKQVYRDFEVVVSDDSRKNKERKKIKKLLLHLGQETGLDIKYIFTRHSLGQSKNTNQGLNHVRGKWVRILHSDDLLSSATLQNEYDIINKYPDAYALFHNVVSFQKQLNEIKTDNQFVYGVHSAQFIIDNSLHSFCAIPSSLLFKAEMIKDIGKFDPAIFRACDWDFWSRIVFYILKNKKKIIHIQDKNVFYRIHNKSNTNKISTYLKIYKELEFLAKQNEKRLIAINYDTLSINYYNANALIYRKKRLISDYKKLPLFFKVFLFTKIKRYLLKGIE